MRTRWREKTLKRVEWEVTIGWDLHLMLRYMQRESRIDAEANGSVWTCSNIQAACGRLVLIAMPHKYTESLQLFHTAAGTLRKDQLQSADKHQVCCCWCMLVVQFDYFARKILIFSRFNATFQFFVVFHMQISKEMLVFQFGFLVADSSAKNANSLTLLFFQSHITFFILRKHELLFSTEIKYYH